MDIYFVIVLVFSATFLILFLILRLLRRRWDPTFKRMRELAQWPEESGASAQVLNDAGKAKARAGLARLLELAGRRSGGDNRSGNKMRKSLMSAGYYNDSALRTYMGIKRVFAMISFALFFYLGMIGSQPLHIVLLLAMAGALAFYSVPDMVLKSKARRRQAAVAGGLPDALDLMVICVEAGLGLNAAIMRVGQDLAMRCRPLSDEFIRVTRDLRTGSSREKALRALSQRNQVEDLKILVGALVLADKLGTSIADTLRAQADSLRTRIKQKAEEQAAKAGIKMLLPLVLFILPALFIILMGPAALMMLESLSQ
jgi:tight adherence protein C